MTKTNTAATPGQAVEQAREVLARWEAELAAATAELESVRDRAGGEVLDDPKAAERLPRVIGDLTAQVDIAERAIRAQGPRVVAAERAYLLSEAEKLRPTVKRAENALQRHREKTAELLRLLEEHEGPFVPKPLLDFERGAKVYERPRSELLEDEVTAARLPVLVLEELAAGRDPMQHPDLRDCVPAETFPACVWGPEALVPCSRYQRYAAALDGSLATSMDQASSDAAVDE